MSAFTVPFDPLSPFGRRPSGARLYHSGSTFEPPRRRKLCREIKAKILFVAEALDRRTRQPRQHGGVLKRTGLAVLRALLNEFYNKQTGECYPSYETLAVASGCCRETVRKALKALELTGLIEIARRKAVATFVSRVHRIKFDCAVQTSNSYVFNFPIGERAENGDLALPLFKPKEPEAKFRSETSPQIKKTTSHDLNPELKAALESYGHAREQREAERA
jgi:hypothetical protein